MPNPMWASGRVPSRELGLSELSVHELLEPGQVIYNNRATVHKDALGVVRFDYSRDPGGPIRSYRGVTGANAIAMGLHAGGQTDGADRGLPGKDAATIGGLAGAGGTGSRGSLGLRDVGRALSAAGAAASVVPGAGLLGVAARAIGSIIQSFAGPTAVPQAAPTDPTTIATDQVLQPDITTVGPVPDVVPDVSLPMPNAALPEDIPSMEPPDVAVPTGETVSPSAPSTPGGLPTSAVIEGQTGDHGAVGGGAVAGAEAGAEAGF